MYTVLKASGKTEPFNESKVLASIGRAGIPQKLHLEVLNHIKNNLHNNTSTEEIYQQIQNFLAGTKYKYSQSKYSLKRAIMDLGPTGFPFEVYVAEILSKAGFQTKISQVLSGKCVIHEVDIVALKEGRKVMVECKFHNKPGIKSDLHVSMYTKARFDDLKDKHKFSEALLVTNTKISSDALAYAFCENVKVISWSYPEGEGLRDLIEKYKLYPITQLTSLSMSQKQLLLAKNVVLTRFICERPDMLKELNLSQDQLREIVLESKTVCNL